MVCNLGLRFQAGSNEVPRNGGTSSGLEFMKKDNKKLMLIEGLDS